jgi:predicted dinucleotide-binding enzyme
MDMAQRIGIIGAGSVGTALATGLAAAGHDVVVGVRDPGDSRHQAGPSPVATIADAIRDAAVIILAVPSDALRMLVPQLDLRPGQVVVDATNAVGVPIPDGHETLGDFVASLVPPAVAVVKAFSTVGAEHLAGRGEGPATFLPIAGDEAGTAIVADLAGDLGFDVADLGGRDAFGLVENHARLWIHLAFRRGWGRNFTWTTVRHVDV